LTDLETWNAASDNAKTKINVLLQSGSRLEFLIAATALLPESEDEADLTDLSVRAISCRYHSASGR